MMFAKTIRAKMRWKSVSIRNPQRFGVADVRDRPQVGLFGLTDYTGSRRCCSLPRVISPCKCFKRSLRDVDA
eukprot:1158597-Prorocentrum_minimum.AAC.1